jgi:hypothetical protein
MYSQGFFLIKIFGEFLEGGLTFLGGRGTMGVTKPNRDERLST